MSTIKNFFLLSLLSVLFCSCNEDAQHTSYAVVFSKGELNIQCENCPSADTIPSNFSGEICLGTNAMVVLSNGEKQIILPLKGKDCYGSEDLKKEFGREDSELGEDYLSYYLDAISKKDKEEEVSAMVSRGNPLQMISPHSNCDVLPGDSLSFSWNTSLQAEDSIIFELRDEKGLLYGDTLPAVPLQLNIALSKLEIHSGASYSWQLYLPGIAAGDAVSFQIAPKGEYEAFIKQAEKARQLLQKEYPTYVIDNLIDARRTEGGYCL